MNISSLTFKHDVLIGSANHTPACVLCLQAECVCACVISPHTLDYTLLATNTKNFNRTALCRIGFVVPEHYHQQYYANFLWYTLCESPAART